MLDFKRCANCGGRKKVMALGMMEKECPTCDGLGHVPLTPIAETIVDSISRSDETVIASVETVALPRKPEPKPKAESKPKPKPKSAFAVHKLAVKDPCQDKTA